MIDWARITLMSSLGEKKQGGKRKGKEGTREKRRKENRKKGKKEGEGKVGRGSLMTRMLGLRGSLQNTAGAWAGTRVSSGEQAPGCAVSINSVWWVPWVP